MDNKRYIQLSWKLTLLALLAVLAVAISPAARAADVTAANEAELSAAITEINAAGAGDHTITLTADITLTAPLPPFSNTEATGILLEGGENLLNAAGVGTALVIQGGTNVTIQNLTITGGVGSSFPDGQSGGAIANRGNLTILRSSLIGNTAYNGGAIVNYGNQSTSPTLTLESVNLSENEAIEFGGGIYNNAGGGSATVTVIKTNMIGNETLNSGGAIANHGLGSMAKVDIIDSVMTGNDALNGGAISNNGNAGQAVITMTGSTLWNNNASYGGGIVNNGNLGVASVSLINSTVSENNATIQGGGVLNVPNGGVVEASLTFTTVAGNNAPLGGGVVNRPGGTIELAASILVAGEQGTACATLGDSVITSDGYNLDSDDSCGLTSPGDIPGGDAALEPIALNAPGTTETHALGETSQAHNVIPEGTFGCGDPINTDQRGSVRPTPHPLCDIGAYESDYTDEEPPPPPVCEPPYAPATEEALNAAIACVNDAGAGSHTITLAGNINLTAPTTPFNNTEAGEIILDGDGFILNGNQSGTVLTIEPETTVRVMDIFITNGQGTSGPTSDWAGGIYNRGHVTLHNSTLSANSAARGGGIVNYGDISAASLTVVRSTLSGNTATENGGGILNTSSDVGSAELNVVNSTLSGNSAVAGGGLYNETAGGSTAANLVYATLAANTATEGGGGIHTSAEGGNASVTLATTIITNGPGGGDDCARPSGTIISTGYNLDGDNTCNLTQANDRPAANADLLPLGLNAPGQTPTHALG